jgi:transposase-like protein
MLKKAGTPGMAHFQARFQARFENETQCLAYLAELRWPDGFDCPECGGSEAWQLKARPRVWECCGCGAQISVTAGTVFHHSRTPLPKWFLGAYLMGRDTRGASAMLLQRELGISYQTAWTMTKKLRHGIGNDLSKFIGNTISTDEEKIGTKKRIRPNGKSRENAGAPRFSALGTNRRRRRNDLRPRANATDARTSLVAWGVARHLNKYIQPNLREATRVAVLETLSPMRQLATPIRQIATPSSASATNDFLPIPKNLENAGDWTVQTHPTGLLRYAQDWNFRFIRRRVIGSAEALLIRRAMESETITYRDLIKGGRLNAKPHAPVNSGKTKPRIQR